MSRREGYGQPDEPHDEEDRLIDDAQRLLGSIVQMAEKAWTITSGRTPSKSPTVHLVAYTTDGAWGFSCDVYTTTPVEVFQRGIDLLLAELTKDRPELADVKWTAELTPVLKGSTAVDPA